MLDLSVNAFLLYGNTVNMTDFCKIQVKIAKSTLRFMLQLCNGATSNVEGHNISTPGYVIGLHFIVLPCHCIIPFPYTTLFRSFLQNSGKNRKIDVTIYVAAL